MNTSDHAQRVHWAVVLTLVIMTASVLLTLVALGLQYIVMGIMMYEVLILTHRKIKALGKDAR